MRVKCRTYSFDTKKRQNLIENILILATCPVPGERKVAYGAMHRVRWDTREQNTSNSLPNDTIFITNKKKWY